MLKKPLQCLASAHLTAAAQMWRGTRATSGSSSRSSFSFFLSLSPHPFHPPLYQPLPSSPLSLLFLRRDVSLQGALWPVDCHGLPGAPHYLQASQNHHIRPKTVLVFWIQLMILTLTRLTFLEEKLLLVFLITSLLLPLIFGNHIHKEPSCNCCVSNETSATSEDDAEVDDDK